MCTFFLLSQCQKEFGNLELLTLESHLCSSITSVPLVSQLLYWRYFDGFQPGMSFVAQVKTPYSNNYLTQKVNSAEIYKFCTRLLHPFVMCVPFTFVSITLVFTFVCPLHPGDFLLTYLPTDWVLLQLYLLCWSVSKYLLRKY